MKIKYPLTPTIFTTFALITLLILGTWQVKRLIWKNNMISEIHEKASIPSVELPFDKINIEDFKYRKVKVKGHFLHEKEIHLFTGPREMRGDPGYNIFTPLERKDGSFVLINRGWVPAKLKDPTTRPETLVQGEITLTGMLHNGEKQGTFTPNNDPQKNMWFWIDIPEIASFTGNAIKNVYVRVLADESEINTLPIPGSSYIDVRNDHLQYAIIWYSLAVILLVIYFLYIKSHNNELTTKTVERKKNRKKIK